MKSIEYSEIVNDHLESITEEEVAKQWHYVPFTLTLSSPPRDKEDNERNSAGRSSYTLPEQNPDGSKAPQTIVSKNKSRKRPQFQHDPHVPTPVSQVDMTKAESLLRVWGMFTKAIRPP
ncbi:6224_t:CDS:2 [Ambispora gerdemannii]|uniref:6224_t:CDS:1 n=1 Tax=Ambispora gerdemannii TaxID=144530 RepID=A0A9N9D6A6_9GLOM|nr:6224_t:CDS:2 [Ambispora gerdemannii]